MCLEIMLGAGQLRPSQAPGYTTLSLVEMLFFDKRGSSGHPVHTGSSKCFLMFSRWSSERGSRNLITAQADGSPGIIYIMRVLEKNVGHKSYRVLGFCIEMFKANVGGQAICSRILFSWSPETEMHEIWRWSLNWTIGYSRTVTLLRNDASNVWSLPERKTMWAAKV